MGMPYQRARVLCCLLAMTAGRLLIAAPDGQTAEALLQRADQSFNEIKYADAAKQYERARQLAADDGALQYRASVGLVRSLLRVADFTGARHEAMRLIETHPGEADAIVLDGDTLWSVGLFAEAEQRFRDALA